MKIKNVLIYFSILFLLVQSTHASEKTPWRARNQKVIDFEDELVEGLNKRPLDSLSQISERNRHHKKNHLYRKRAGFRPETAETLRELRCIQ